MVIFETERLNIRELVATDADSYFDMMGNQKVMELIPRKVMTRAESDEHLNGFINSDYSVSDTKLWAFETKDKNEFIGICAFLKNEDKEDEIGYRLVEKHWRKGFGTEIAKGMISFGFEQLKMEEITADVDTKNLNSVKILGKFMSTKKEFFNPSDNCMDRRYVIAKSNW